MTEGVRYKSEGGPIHVLHVDDDACFLETAKAILEKQGTFQVDTASCVEEAWKKMKKEEYDAVVSDYQMPRKDGLQFLKELRAKGNSMPFILFTGKGREEVAIEALNLDADGYYNKVGSPESVYGELAHGICLAVERRRAVLRIWQDEERLRCVFASSPDAIMVSDLDGNVVDCNEATLKLGGYSSKEEIVGKNSFNFIAEKDRKLALEKMKHIFDLGTITGVEYTAFKKNGETYVAETSGSVLKDSAGKPAGFVIVIEDVTKRRNAEEALKQRNYSLATLNAVSIELASLPFDVDVREFLVKKLREITGAAAVAFADYDAGNQTLVARLAELEPGMQEKFTRLLGTSLGEIRCPVSEKDYHEITKSVIGKRQRLTESTYGGIPPSVGAEVQKLLGVDRFIGIAYVIEGELYGTSLLAIKVGVPDPPLEMLESFGHMAAVSLRRRRAEACAIESEGRYRELAESISDVFFAFDKDLRYTYWNKASEKLTGIKAKDAVGKSLTEVFPNVKGTEIEQVFQNVVKTRKPRVLLTECQLKGEDSIFELNARPTRNGLSVFVKDITERKKAEVEIKRSQKKYRSLVEQSLQGIVVVQGPPRAPGPPYHIVFANSALSKIMGYTPEELTSLSPQEISVLVHPEDRDVFNARFKDHLEGKPALSHYEVRGIRKDGAVVWLELSSARIEYNGEPAMQATILDSTERKKTFERLRVLNEKLDAIGKLTRHDVGNKLSAVVNNTYLAKKMLPNDHKALDYLRKIETACRETTRILDFATACEGLGVEGLTLMDVGKAVEDAVSLISGMKGVKVANNCQGLTVMADSALAQLFFNLIENSLKHGKNVSQIKVHYEEGKDRLKLLYEDDGVGIPKANKPKLFDWGFTTDNGSGYGLPLIRNMMKIYGWTIDEEGQPGKGAKFVITIPKEQSARQPVETV